MRSSLLFVAALAATLIPKDPTPEQNLRGVTPVNLPAQVVPMGTQAVVPQIDPNQAAKEGAIPVPVIEPGSSNVTVVSPDKVMQGSAEMDRVMAKAVADAAQKHAAESP